MNMLEKLDAAVDWLGDRWVFSPAKRVTKLPPTQQIQMHKSDVAATFARVRKQLAKTAELNNA